MGFRIVLIQGIYLIQFGWDSMFYALGVCMCGQDFKSLICNC